MHSIIFACIASLVIGFLFYELYNSGKRKDTTNVKDWIWLFFLSIFTHPILDSFTPYGTQLFLPFTDYRIAFNNISVVDLFYTVPFLFCIVVSMFFKRINPKRIKWAKAGIYISSIYMLFTLGNKIYIDSVFKKSFQKAGIEYSRFSAQPTISNNILWYSVAESETNYHLAFYSIFDSSDTAENILTIPKNHELLDMTHPDLERLTWFSKNYYTLSKSDATNQLLYKDLRYPLLNENDPNSSLMSFELIKEEERWNTRSSRPNFEGKTIWDFFGGIYSRAFRDF